MKEDDKKYAASMTSALMEPYFFIFKIFVLGLLMIFTVAIGVTVYQCHGAKQNIELPKTERGEG